MQARRYNTGKPRFSLIAGDADNLIADCTSFLSTAYNALNEFKSVSSDAITCLKVAAINVNSQYCDDYGLYIAECGIHPSLRLKLAEVYTVGAEKYSDYDESGKRIYDGAHNWRIGLSWMSTLDSALRHMESYALGEENDPETGLHHLAHSLWNIYALMDHVIHHPEKDDRFTPSIPRIGLDIDGVIADFEKAYLDAMGKPEHTITSWNDPLFRKYFFEVTKDDSFWLNIPLVEDLLKKPLSFCPVVYVTARPVSNEVTERYLFEINNLPMAPVITVGHDISKTDACKKYNVELFIDDRYENYVELNKSGVPCLLKTRKHNAHYNVGCRRLESIHDLNKIWS